MKKAERNTAAQVIEAHGAEWVAVAMIQHIAETIRKNGAAVLSAIPEHDFGTQVLEFDDAIRAALNPEEQADD